jgi:hypothetical protein
MFDMGNIAIFGIRGFVLKARTLLAFLSAGVSPGRE